MSDKYKMTVDPIVWLRDYEAQQRKANRGKPEQYIATLSTIKDYFYECWKDGRYLIIENKDLSASYSVKVRVMEVYERWCLTEQTIYANGELTKIPYTIQYVDILQSMSKKSTTTKLPKIIVEGVNPFD